MKKYFVCSNSGKGFINYFKDNLEDIDKVYIIKGGPGTGKSTLMKKLASKYEQAGLKVDYIYCSSDPDSLDGIIIDNDKIAIVDGTTPHVIEPEAAGATGEYINVGMAWNVEKLENEKNNIISLQKQIAECYNKAYDYLYAAKHFHDDLEKYYIEATDYSILDDIYDELAERINTFLEKR